jgi:UDP-glucose 4-epimerase
MQDKPANIHLVRDITSYFRQRNVLITGGAGFIGSNLAHALVRLGANVTVVDAMLPLYGGNTFNLHGMEDRIRFVEGDVRDATLMGELVRDKEIVFHLAAQVSYIDSKERPFLDLDINGRGHLTVLESVRLNAPRARVLFSSSRLVYGKILTVPVKEDHPTDPLSIYGIHKLLGEKYCRYYTDTWDVHAVSMRIPNPFGPRQQMKHSKYSIVGWFVRQAMEGNTIQVFGDGRQERDYLYIDDIVDAFLHLAVKGKTGEVYNVGTHERITFGEMVDTVLEKVGSGKKEYVPWPEHYEKNETGDYIADTSKIHAHTGWRPNVPLSEGIDRMVDYYRQYRDNYW